MIQSNPLAALMAQCATGYAAVIDDILDIRTVTDTRNGAAQNALYLSGIGILSTCTDRDCDCMVKALQMQRPDIRLVQIKVEVSA